MRVLVIGGSGFIGRFLVPRLLGAGHDVSVVQRPESGRPLPAGARAVRVDRNRLADAARELRALAPDVVVDLVLSSGRQAAVLMDVMRGHAGRVVAVSSMDVYRATGVLHGLEEGPLEPVPLREDSPLRTRLQTYPEAQIRMLQGVFGWLDAEYDKIPVERAVLGDPALPATVLRLPMVYGPGDPLHRCFPLLRRMDDARPVIVLPASVAAWRGPRGYVENVAAAIALAAESGGTAPAVYNVGEVESLTELEWARRVAEAAGWRGELVVVPDEAAPASVRMPGNLAQHWAVDSSRIRAELGYAEPVAPAEGLRRTVAWERAHPPAAVAPSRFDYAAEDAAAARPEARRYRAS
jgi:nucleoside-diphosphate-sugar epimerase